MRWGLEGRSSCEKMAGSQRDDQENYRCSKQGKQRLCGAESEQGAWDSRQEAGVSLRAVYAHPKGLDVILEAMGKYWGISSREVTWSTWRYVRGVGDQTWIRSRQFWGAGELCLQRPAKYSNMRGLRLMNDNLMEAEQIRGVSGNHSNSGADLGSEKERRVFPMGRQNVKMYIYMENSCWTTS